MESFTKELVWNASEQLFPHNTLSYFIKFLPEQLKLDGQWEVAISEKSYTSKYQIVTEGKLIFFDKKLSESSEFYYLQPLLYPSITDIVEAMNILIQERHNHSENCIKVKVSRRMQKVEIYFANEASGLAFFSKDLWLIFGSIVGNGFGVMLRGNDLTNQNLLTTLSAYTLSWDTPTWLSTISLATQKFHCCVDFLLIRSSSLETLQLRDSTWTIRHLATCNSDRSSKIFFIVFTLTWDTRLVKSTLPISRYHSSCFDVQKSLQQSFLT